VAGAGAMEAGVARGGVVRGSASEYRLLVRERSSASIRRWNILANMECVSLFYKDHARVSGPPLRLTSKT